MTTPDAHTPAASLVADLWPPEAVEAMRAASSEELLARIGVGRRLRRRPRNCLSAGCVALARAGRSGAGPYAHVPTPIARAPARALPRNSPPSVRPASPSAFSPAPLLRRAAGGTGPPQRAGRADRDERRRGRPAVQRPPSDQGPVRVPADVDHRPRADVAAAKRRGSQVGDHGRGDRDEQHDAEADQDDARQGRRPGRPTRRTPVPVPWAMQASDRRSMWSRRSRTRSPGTAAAPWRRRRR